MRRAAMRVLADYLERHPEALHARQDRGGEVMTARMPRSRLDSRSSRWRPSAAGASAPSRFYTLDVDGDGRRRRRRRSYAVVVGPVIDPAVGRPARVRGAGRAESRRRSTSSIAGPRRSTTSIARAVAGDLAVLLGTSRRGGRAAARTSIPTYRVTIDVQRFDSIPGESVLVEARVGRAPDAPAASTRSGRTVAREPCRARASTRSPPRTAARSRR